MAQVKSEKQEEIVNYLKELRDEILSAFEAFEPTARFEKTPWKHHSGGGGEIATLRGEVFEKAAVNWSGVEGTKLPYIPITSQNLGVSQSQRSRFSPIEAASHPGDRSDAEGIKDRDAGEEKNQVLTRDRYKENEEPFFATGVSLITHMKNPFMPTVHMNVRYFETKHQSWFGGGYDLTPMGFEKEADTRHFHHVALEALGEEIYRDFSKNAAEYFYIKHWKKERGVGGIFFDHHNTGDFEKDFSMWKRVGSTFLDAILPIYERWKDHPYTDEDKAKQNHYRAHYVEFNLLYDRGTKFGFMSGGNPHAILCSMPPTATW